MLSHTPLDLTVHLSPQGIYPAVYGRWTDIWKCDLKQDSQSYEVRHENLGRFPPC
jgi:hypothetical protein